jgi:hypothetical protein
MSILGPFLSGRGGVLCREPRIWRGLVTEDLSDESETVGAEAIPELLGAQRAASRQP